MIYLGFLAVLALSAPLDAQERVVVRETAENSFVASLRTGRELRIEEAQQKLLPAAAGVCQGLIPVFVKYTFGSSKPASAKSTIKANFEFDQTFTCEEQAPVVPHTPPTVISAEESSRLVEFVERETEKAISDANGATQRAFHSHFSPSLSSMLSLGEWLEQQGNLHEKAGLISGRPRLKVTTYTDPPNSPGPGIHIRRR